jgi:hypothetical protein
MTGTAILALAAIAALSGCGGGTSETSSSATTRRNACDLVDRAAIETIAGKKLDLLHDIQEEEKTVCEMYEPGHTEPLVAVTVYWKGGKQRASAYYNDAPASWLIKDDVLVEVASPSFDVEKTRAVFVSISKTALPKL